MADRKLNSNQLKTIQWVVASVQTDDPVEQLEALGNAAWFIKQETDRLLRQESKTPRKELIP